MCGKKVGSGLFPSDSLESHSYNFDEIAHIGPNMVYNDCQKFHLIRMCSRRYPSVGCDNALLVACGVGSPSVLEWRNDKTPKN